MKLTVSMASHRGRVRTKNEDNFYAHGRSMPQINQGTAPCTIELDTDSPRLFGVFDGMGGYSSGERASFLAVQAAHEAANKYLQTSRADSLMLHICSLANQWVCNEMLSGENERIGTTASMVHIFRDTYTVCNVGDSPVFLLRGEELRPIHQEHSERANYERITGKPAPPNKKFRLTQNIGIFTEEMLIEPYCASAPIQPGDLFLLCSDGVTDMVTTERIREILLSKGTTEEKTRILLEEALNNGGKDNITIVLVSAEKPKSKIGPLLTWIGVVVLALVILAGTYFKIYLPPTEWREPLRSIFVEEESTEPSESGETTEPSEEEETTTATEGKENKKPSEVPTPTASTEEQETTTSAEEEGSGETAGEPPTDVDPDETSDENPDDENNEDSDDEEDPEETSDESANI